MTTTPLIQHKLGTYAEARNEQFLVGSLLPPDISNTLTKEDQRRKLALEEAFGIESSNFGLLHPDRHYQPISSLTKLPFTLSIFANELGFSFYQDDDWAKPKPHAFSEIIEEAQKVVAPEWDVESIFEELYLPIDQIDSFLYHANWKENSIWFSFLMNDLREGSILSDRTAASWQAYRNHYEDLITAYTAFVFDHPEC